MTRQQAGFTDSLQEILKQAIDFELTEFHVCMPGKIETYDESLGTATIKPTLSRRFRGAANSIEYPVIQKVPVVQPRTAKAQATLPITKGDLVLIVFADRSIENWDMSRGDEPREVRDLRRHDLSDAFAILGGYPTLNPSPPVNGKAYEVLVKPGTKIAFGNGSVEVLTLFDEVLEKMDSILTNIQLLTVSGVLTGGGISGIPVNAASFVINQTEIALIKTKLEALKT